MTRVAQLPNVDVSIIIGTYGDEKWNTRGDWLARFTYDNQLRYARNLSIEVINVHGDTLAEARNTGAGKARSAWLVFLDADDLLDPDYCSRLTRAVTPVTPGVTLHVPDIFCPSVRGFTAENVWGTQSTSRFCGYRDFEFIDPQDHLPEVTSLIKRNYLPVGAPIWKQTFDRVGGFDEWPVLEDWAFWLKCQRNGAEFGQLEKLSYWINDDHQRNQHPDIDQIANQIRQEHRSGPPQ